MSKFFWMINAIGKICQLITLWKLVQKATWVITAAPTLAAAVVREPTLLFVTERGFRGKNLKLSNHFSCRFFCLLLGIFQCRKTILKLLAIKKIFEEKTFWFFSKLEMNEEDSFREEGRKSSVKLLIKMAFPPGKCLTNKVPNLACLLLQVLLAVNVLGYLIWHIFAC